MASVEWGEYILDDLFVIKTSRGYDAGKMQFVSKGPNTFEFIGRTQVDYGLQGFVKELDSVPNEAKCISVSQIGAIHAQLRQNKWYSSQNMFILMPKINRLFNQWLIVAINRALSKYKGYSSYPTLSSLKNESILLPIKNNQIDFDFMDSFIAELEAERIAELSAYLKVSGLDNYELSIEELNALRVYETIEWREYRIGSLFSRISTKKLPYKAKDLPTEATESYNLPCLTSSFRNQGLNYFVPREGATILKDVISIPSNSDVYRAYFQSREFTVLSDAYAIKWIDEVKELSNYHYLFMVRAINKVTDLPIYSYKMKLGGWNVVKDKMILLPVVDDEVAFDFMEDYTRAISKLAIKDVVQYTDKRIEATKTVVAGHQKEESE
ncbi:restriction endonuclease subunit S [Streptococcus dysgalactiae subsp. equisimilis]|uniref:restriction endonuclease subunit S n=1 Tax=Streptococcus dysgalactiae TaxID=1334 RepID=UPI000A104885|nr:restriction endonuclease subunit S [Streptococcus dysgalactiae]MCY7206120.1 restriction endonuclease subunit S [Streptococcus dysgalactiae]ORJ90678.1 restriction endonuclease [Streptococcus dysgalactiae subsp. equisimilis]TYK93233.1 restriction endonuclease [Streptococcus dysgalactiae]TYL05842.1 restriction endonuclease [Streptococcus dysgalactiae]WEQ76696.1 type I restriction-modification system endonuclease (S) specificity subunit [Streptococcus dysgalactiae subsp. equisimilis]